MSCVLDHLDIAAEHLHGWVLTDDTHHLVNDLLRVVPLMADTDYPYRRPLPQLMIADLSHGHVEAVPDPIDQSLEDLSFPF